MRIPFILIALPFLFACKKESGQPQPEKEKKILLKDIVEPHLPSPFYHFEYDASGQIVFTSFASDLNRYTVFYNNGKIDKMQNNIIVNKDRIQYTYNIEGNIRQITYADSTGNIYTVNELFYDNGKLSRIERSRKIDGNFSGDKVISFAYHTDGNLSDITYHYLPIKDHQEQQYTSHFGDYDSKINIDCYELIHEEFFDHFFLLPNVQLMKNNPQNEVRTGDGINYTVNYSYIYHQNGAPSEKRGALIVTNGTDSGKTFDLRWFYTFY